TLGHRPALQHAVELQAEVVMQAAGGVLLHHEGERLTGRGAALRFGGDTEVALVAIALQGIGHGVRGTARDSADMETPCRATLRFGAQARAVFLLEGLVARTREV